MHELFRKFSQRVSTIIGSVWSFIIFITIILSTGYWFTFSSTWESNIGFIISVVTLSSLFFLQKSQNHSDNATHLKLDELIRAVEGARNEVASAEKQAEEDLEKLRKD